MIIVGAGLSGLIAASMLREEVHAVYEMQPELPNNHSALLRFKSAVVGDATGIPFRKVNVMKSSHPWKNPVADALAYSKKVTGGYTLRSSTTAGGEIEDRYIAPHDFIPRLFEQVKHKIHFGQTLEQALVDAAELGMPVISTIPMNKLVQSNVVSGMINDLPIPLSLNNFKFRTGYTLNVELPEEFDVCATVYIPDPDCQIYRASITERMLILEGCDCDCRTPQTDLIEKGHDEVFPVFNQRSLDIAASALGLDFHRLGINAEVCLKEMAYAKILQIPERSRKAMILLSTENDVPIYSLGRFATWRPKLLLDDVVQDVRIIQQLAAGDASPVYSMKKENQNAS